MQPVDHYCSIREDYTPFLIDTRERERDLFGEKLAFDVTRSEERRIRTESARRRGPEREGRFEFGVNNHCHDSPPSLRLN